MWWDGGRAVPMPFYRCHPSTAHKLNGCSQPHWRSRNCRPASPTSCMSAREGIPYSSKKPVMHSWKKESLSSRAQRPCSPDRSRRVTCLRRYKGLFKVAWIVCIPTGRRCWEPLQSLAAPFRSLFWNPYIKDEQISKTCLPHSSRSI